MVLINLTEIKIEPQTVRRASPLISTQSDARPGAALIIGGIMPKTNDYEKAEMACQRLYADYWPGWIYYHRMLRAQAVS